MAHDVQDPSALPDSPSALTGRWRWHLALGMGLSLLLLVAALSLGWREYQARREHAALHAALVIDGIERQLHARLARLGEELARHGTAAARAAPGGLASVAAQPRSRAIRRLVVADATGNAPAVAAGGLVQPPAGTGLRLLPPVPGAEVVQVAWDGTPGLRVLADVDPQWFADVVQGHALAQGAVVNLVHASRRMYARSDANAEYLGRSLADAALFASAHRARRSGSYGERSILNGQPRQFVYRWIDGTPLAIVVGTPDVSIAGPARAFVAALLLAALLLAATWLWLIGDFIRAHHRQALLLRRLDRAGTRLREAQALAGVGDWHWDVDTGEVHWSDELYRIYGLEPATTPLRMEAILAWIHPDDVDRIRAWAQSVGSRSEARDAEVEFRIRRASDGATRWILARVEAELEPGGRRLHGIQQDITPMALVRERLRLAQEMARLGDWEWDVASGEIRWSRAMYEIYGLEPGTYVPHADSVFGLVHPDDRGRVQAYAAMLRESGAPCEAEFRVVRADGVERVISARGARETSADGRTVIHCVQQDVTELAQARDRVGRAEQQYRYLFERNPVPMWVFDSDSLRILAVNDAMVGHYGYSRETLLAGSILDIRPEHERAAVQEAVQGREGERGQGTVWTHLHADGSLLRMAIYSHDIVFDGRRARLIAAQDVTAREMSEERFRLIARATSDAVYDVDLARNTVWWGGTFYSLFGYEYTSEPATVHAWSALVHPDDLARVEASLAAAQASDAVEWEDEYRFRRADGSYAEVIDRGFMLRDAQGRAMRLVGGMLDVTESRHAEADLRLLRRAVEAADSGVVICDAHAPDMPIVYANPAFEEMTGYAAEELLGRNCRILQAGDREQPGIHAIRAALHDQVEVRVLLRNYRKDGTLFWNELHLSPVRSGSGELTHYVGALTDVTSRQQFEQQLAHRATHDELTGLPNRQLLEDRLQRAILNADRYGRSAAVVFVDLDDFKLINDSLGHSAGDEALRLVAERLRGATRDTDTVGRFGGDEFVVVLTEQTDESGIARVIQRVVAAVTAPMEIAGVSHTLTPSIGYCRYPEHGSDPEALLMRADMAMYEAKRQGRNRAVGYRSEFDEAISMRLRQVSRLREALQQKEFMLEFQPLWATDGTLSGLEALVRWQHPERGLLLPGEFIGVCEESGLIVELGRRVLREAGRHHAMLAAAGLGHLRISVNVSAAQFAQDLYGDVVAAIDEFSLPPGAFELELTESVIMDNPQRAIATMERIAALGARISVDDFGTGHSSLSYLKRLPIHRLKIDRSFVQDLPDDADDAAICSSIIAMAHALGLEVVAEGVETQAQLEWLRQRRCDHLQGFLLARPQPFDTLLPQLLQRTAAPSA